LAPEEADCVAGNAICPGTVSVVPSKVKLDELVSVAASLA
jgi:hypothetical protein